jgi:methyl-accepting chemotaxis protein
MLGLIALLCLFAVTGAITVLQMNKMGEKATDIKENWLPSVSMLGEVNTLAAYSQKTLNEIGLETDIAEINRLDDNLQEAIRDRSAFAAVRNTHC